MQEVQKRRARATGSVEGADTAPAAAPQVGNGRRPSPEEASGRLQEDLDRVSLTQALVDAEAASARVIDLTERLVEARQEVVALRQELDELRLEYTTYKAEQERMKSSQAYRLAERIWALRNALGI